MADKRRSPRIQFEGPVVIDVERHHTVLGTAANLSLGGMFVDAIDEPLAIAVGASVVLHVRISGAIHELPGVVRWARGGGIGVQFGLLGAAQTHAITEAVARHATSGMRERAATIEAMPAVGKKRA
jgi:hypothetical protein